jgi:hypothetical protein
MAIGIYVLIVGIGASFTAYGFLPDNEPLVHHVLALIPAAVLGPLGLGLVMHKRWAFFGYLGLTAIALPVWIVGVLPNSAEGGSLNMINGLVSIFLSIALPALLVFRAKVFQRRSCAHDGQ